MARKYRAAIIGLGRVGWMLEQDPLRAKPCTHAGCWQEHPDVELVAGCDIDSDRLQSFGKHFSIAALYHDYREMLAREELDFVSISAYATERCEMVMAAAESGVKGLWIEKAVATSLAETETMMAELSKYDIPAIVSYMRRWENNYIKVRELIDAGEIGRLQTINVHFTGNMLHTGTHAFDILRMLGGEVSAVQAWLRDESGGSLQSGYRYGSNEDFMDFGGNAVLHFAGGGMAFIHGEDRDYFRFEFEILGSQGMIRIGNTQAELWKIGESDYAAGLAELVKQEFPAPEWRHSWVARLHQGLRE